MAWCSALNAQPAKSTVANGTRPMSSSHFGLSSSLAKPRRRQIRIIADNLSAHKTERVRQFLTNRKGVHISLWPTYFVWPNQVEIWFSNERHVIAHDIFTWKQNLSRKLMRYVTDHSPKIPKPASSSWNYTGGRNYFQLPLQLLQALVVGNPSRNVQ